MVTAGIFMVARMSPLFEYSPTALSFVIVIGATTAFFMGLLGVVNNDIKRVIAYSTLSQLGYMTVALGASAYSAAIFHLMTHAFFKALLFLAAGSVIIGMHHEQDMRKMGGLAKYMPITAITSWIGALALVGTPFFAGFYSKDTIIEAAAEVAHKGQLWGASYAYYCVLAGVFVTSLYTFRMLFMTFHGPERFRHAHGHGHADEQPAAGDPGPGAGHTSDAHAGAVPSALHHGATHADAHGKAQSHGDDHDPGVSHDPPHESPAVVTVPLIALAIPSVLIGLLTVGTVLFGDFFGPSIKVLEEHDVIGELGKEFHGAVSMALHGFFAPPYVFLIALAGAVTAWVLFLKKPSLANSLARTLSWLRTILVNKYYFDWINENIIAAASRLLGRALWRGGDGAIIDGLMVDGTASTLGRVGSIVRKVQSGYLYSYAFWMIIGLAVLLGYFLMRRMA
jgi:NADH-quinone oxidoreductase subunit L